MKLAIFDFDGTLFSGDTLPFLLTQWYRLNYSRKKLLNVFLPLLPMYLVYKTGINTSLSREELREQAVNRFNNIFDGMYETEVNSFFISAANAVMPQLNTRVLEELTKTKDNEYFTVLLSGAYFPFLKKIGNELGFDAVLGTNIHFNNGLFNSSQKMAVLSGERKLTKLLECFKGKIDWQESTAFADSYSDLPLLKLVGKPICVNPDEKLKQTALELNWEIIA